MSSTLYPAEFISRMQQLLGNDFSTFIESLNAPAPVSIRLNPAKPWAPVTNHPPIPWSTNGLYLPERPAFTFHPVFHAGAYYVQEASSMFIEQLYRYINPGNNAVNVLDLCAAPGGKSTHLLSLINRQSLLVSNEVISNRNSILRENISKWGLPNVVVTQNKAEDFSRLPGFFDIILIDAPCSGEGLFRKDKEAVNEWSEANVAMCSLRQKDILSAALPALKPGGYLIYSTCTYEAAENDQNVEWLLQQGLTLALPAAGFNGISPTKYGYQFFPHKIKGEGFYASLLQKPAGELAGAGNTRQPAPTSPALAGLAEQYLQQPGNFILSTHKDTIVAHPKSCYYAMQYASSALNARQAGIIMGHYKGKDFIPSPQLALSTAINMQLPAIDLTAEQALTFLRCETINPGIQAHGWYLARHAGFNLGWLKLIGNRANNYYPREWRILKQASVTQL